MPFNEDIILTVYDFYFCVWKVGIEVCFFFICRHLYLLQWYQKDLITQVDVGAHHVQGSYWSASQMEQLIFGTLWINLINGQCSILSVQWEYHQWSSMNQTLTYSLLAVNKAHFIYWSCHLLLWGKLVIRTKQWTNSGTGRFKVYSTLIRNFKTDSNNHSILGPNRSKRRGREFKKRKKNKRNQIKKKLLT